MNLMTKPLITRMLPTLWAKLFNAWLPLYFTQVASFMLIKRDCLFYHLKHGVTQDN